MDSKENFINLMQIGLEKEVEAEHYAKKLVEILHENGVNLAMSTRIYDDEIKHQMIIRSILEELKNI